MGMSNIIKIILIVVLFIISILLVVLLILPNMATSTGASLGLEEEKEHYTSNVSRLHELEAIKDEYNGLNAVYQKYSMQIPSKNDLEVLTNEIYEIASYSGLTVTSVDYSELIKEEKEGEERIEKTIDADFILEGDYYNIINFIRTIEKMPRLVLIDSVAVQLIEDDYENLNAYISAEIYYIGE